MSRFDRKPDTAESNDPERLRFDGGTELERRVLGAAARERPSRELAERMALAIGVAPPPTLDVELPEPAPTADLAAPAASTSARAILPWLSAPLIIVAAVIVTQRGTSEVAPTPQISTPIAVPAPMPVPSSAPAPEPRYVAPTPVQPTVEAPLAPRTRAASTNSASDIQGQIALIDAARASIASGASSRALELLRQYQSKYAVGSFGPEAKALKIEALAKLGRTAEARSLAERFVTEHRGTPLADRVSRITK